ncbi:hypothetical protein SFRURICE_002559 [Spodoptera frugiperda]|uniref:SFRICE_014045 n=1 Tax=Spodoptera frugiperda TaxID=7108 RepID=A0A2H1W5Z7_SPOFR|nr:hypothetical protein SFRURICE_002559 [Spodoptera frugiperda]
MGQVVGPYYALWIGCMTVLAGGLWTVHLKEPVSIGRNLENVLACGEKLEEETLGDVRRSTEMNLNMIMFLGPERDGAMCMKMPSLLLMSTSITLKEFEMKPHSAL